MFTVAAVFVLEAVALAAVVVGVFLHVRDRFRSWYMRREQLGERTEHWLRSLTSPVTVISTYWHHSGERATLELADGAQLHIRYFWPRPVELVRLRAASFHDAVGWKLSFDAPNGDPTVVWAWLVEHHPATGGTTTSVSP